MGRGYEALEGARPHERGVRRHGTARQERDAAPVGARRMSATYPSLHTQSSQNATCAALWDALRDVTDPEMPISVVDMGLIVDVAQHEGTVYVKLIFAERDVRGPVGRPARRDRPRNANQRGRYGTDCRCRST